VREALAADPRVMVAARIAHAFKIDPITVLTADRRTWVIRAAAMQVIVNDQKPTPET
jgi:hypothetical protein